MERPLISVVIPVFNREKYLREAIESTLAEDYNPVEVIVVDDGSTDRSGEVASAFERVRLVTIPHAGVAVARNAGIEACSGDLIAMLDSDDLMAQGRLRLQADYLASHPDVRFVLGRQEIFIEPGGGLPSWVYDPRVQLDIPGADLGGGEALAAVYPMGTVMARRQAYEEVGLYDPRFEVGEDIDWFFRANELGLEVDTIDEVVVLRRLHGDNLTRERSMVREGAFMAFKARIDRKRARRSTADAD